MVNGDVCERARREMRLAYLAGYLRARGLRRRPTYTPPVLPVDVAVSTAPASPVATHVL